ncbi:hypothetical protein D3C80_1872340 [compost metagenome]
MRFGAGRQGADVQGGKQASGVDGFGVHGGFLKVRQVDRVLGRGGLVCLDGTY